MHLVRDVLDKQVVDRNGRPLGRVDTIILDIRDGRPPLVSAIEIGLVSIFDRLHPFAGRCARAIETVLGVDAGRPVRVPFAAVINIDRHVTIDLAATDTNVLAVERLIQPYVTSIPGAK